MSRRHEFYDEQLQNKTGETKMEGGGRSNGQQVCITGGTGFIGSYLIKKLLHHGYHVHATIRSSSLHNRDTTFLTDLPGAADNLKLFEADLIHPETFSSAIAGCSAVIHVATPALDFSNSQHQEEEAVVVERSVTGTIGVLRACLRAGTVKRVVYTSGTAAVVFNGGWDGGEVMDERCWSDVEYGRGVIKNGFSKNLMVAKTVTERKAVEFAEENGLELVTLIPSVVVGPFICPKFPASVRLALAMVFGEKDNCDVMTEMSMVHVEDVARAYVFLLENHMAKGRYICSSHRVTLLDQKENLSTKYPDLRIPAMQSLKEIKGHKVPKISSKKLLDAGFEFKYDLDDMFDATIECCITKGYL